MATKVICLHCDARLTAGVAFCPTCAQPTRWATHEDRITWEVEQWRKIKSAPAPRAPVHRVTLPARRREPEPPPAPRRPAPAQSVVIPRQGPPLVQSGDMTWARREAAPPAAPVAPPVAPPISPAPAPAPAPQPPEATLAQIASMLEQLDARFTSIDERLDVIVKAQTLPRPSMRRVVAQLRGLWRYGPDL